MKDGLNERLRDHERERFADNVPDQWNEIQIRLKEEPDFYKVSGVSYWAKVAASLIFLALLSFVFYLFVPNQNEKMASKRILENSLKDITPGISSQAETINQFAIKKEFFQKQTESSNFPAPQSSENMVMKSKSRANLKEVAPSGSFPEPVMDEMITSKPSNDNRMPPAQTETIGGIDKGISKSARMKTNTEISAKTKEDSFKQNWIGNYNNEAYQATIMQNGGLWVMRGNGLSEAKTSHVIELSESFVKLKMDKEAFTFLKIKSINNVMSFEGSNGKINVTRTEETINIEFINLEGKAMIWGLKRAFE